MDRVAARRALDPYGWSRASRALYAAPTPVAAPIRRPPSATPYPARWAGFTERVWQAPTVDRPAPPVVAAQPRKLAAPVPAAAAVDDADAAADAGPSRYARTLGIRTLSLPGWQRFLLLEGAAATAAVLALGELASVWVLLVLPGVCAAAVKLFDAINAELPTDTGGGQQVRTRAGEHGHVRALPTDAR